MRELSRIQEAIFREPWAVTKPMLRTIAGIIDRALTPDASGIRLQMPLPAPKPQMQMIGGVPVIEIEGVITKKAGLFTDISGATSIDNLRSQFREALMTDALAIFFDVNTPGGSVQGVTEFAAEIWNARQSGGKTIVGCIDSQCCSAGIWLMSQCDELFLTKGSTAGSIGVIASMQDDSRQKKNDGIDETIFRSSELKAPGNGPLTPLQIVSIQDQIDTYTAMFREDVMRGRAGTGLDLTSFDPGAVFIGQKAVDMGLCDGVSTLENEILKYQKK